MHTLRKIAPTTVALALLAAAADVVIFHRAKAANLLRSGVARIPPGFFQLAVALLTGLVLLALLIILRRLASSVASFVRYLWTAPGQYYGGLGPKDRITLANDVRKNQIQVVTIVVQALGGIAVLIGIYFAWANLKITQRGQAETLRLTNEGQITDRFTKAIEEFGATDDKGLPQLELRLGGIHALERIARDSERDYWPIIEILTAYVRENAPLTGAHGNKPREDIQAVITVIGRRERTYGNGESHRLNFFNTYLTGASLFDAHLEGAYLVGAYLIDANLEEAHLEGAMLMGAKLGGAYLINTHLEGSHIECAFLEEERTCANLEEAHLTGTHLENAYLFSADLRDAYLKDAHLDDTHLQDVVLEGTHLDHTDLSKTTGLTQQQIDSAFGDETTKLPPYIIMPKLWKDLPPPN